MIPPKLVVTDYIEPDLEWESQEMAQRGVEFLAYQLKFAPNSEVIAATRDADVVVVNMVPVTPEITGATGAAALGFEDHQAVIEDMAAAIEHGREPMITLASVRPTLEWALAMYQSAQQDAPVDLPLADEQDVW